MAGVIWLGYDPDNKKCRNAIIAFLSLTKRKVSLTVIVGPHIMKIMTQIIWKTRGSEVWN
jgi:hypothetical protein